MKILQVSCGGLGNGGVQKVIMNIKNNFLDDKMDIIVFTDEKRYYDDEFEKKNGTIYRINIRNSKTLFKVLKRYLLVIPLTIRIYRILKKEKYDVIHCHNEYESGICLFAAFLSKVPIRIAHFHRADYELESKFYYKLYAFIMKTLIKKYSTDIICCSEATKSSFFKNYNNEKIKILYNCIDIKKFHPIFKNNTYNTDIIISHIGMYCDNKNQMFLLDIAQELSLKKIPFKLQLIGFGKEYKTILEEKVKEKKLVNNVIFINGNTDIYKILSKTDIFVFPSKKEGFGISLLEAQAMNIPCIASDTITKESNLGLTKYISLDKTSKEWVKQILKIQNSKEKMKLNQHKLKEFDITEYMRKIRNIYYKK